MSSKILSRKKITLFMLLLWAVTLITLIATLMVSHWSVLPLPSGNDPKLAKAIDNTRSIKDLGQWYATHVLYAQCNCSNRVLEHILNSPRPSGINEKLILVDHNPKWEKKAQEIGFPYEVITQQELKTEFNIESAPLFIVSNPESKIMYAGGYTDRKQGLSIKDTDIIQNVMNNNPMEPIPLFGCAVSKALQTIVDPFGFKYSG